MQIVVALVFACAAAGVLEAAEPPAAASASSPGAVAAAPAWDALLDAILNEYSHRDRMVSDRPERFAEYRAAALRAESPAAFAAVAADVLARARDIHLWLWIEGRKLETCPLVSISNRDETRLRVSVPALAVLNDSVSSAMIARENSPPIGYVSVTAWPADPMSVEPAIAFVAGLSAPESSDSSSTCATTKAAPRRPRGVSLRI